MIVVSNRLPYKLEDADGSIQVQRSEGGLVTALDPILRLKGGIWVGWAGTDRELGGVDVNMEDSTERYSLKPVPLSSQEVEEYYLGYANKCLWPLFHYFQEYCEFDNGQWETYKKVNRRFADAVVSEHREGDFIWVQDYHLALVPRLIREQIPGARIGFFLHIPFPNIEIYQVEPHAEELIEGMLGADVVGFHLRSSARHFIEAVTTLTEHRQERAGQVSVAGRRVKVGGYPISIDFRQFDTNARREGIEDEIRELRRGYRAAIFGFGVDRLDYSKGIPERLRAIETMLRKHRELQGRFTFIQVSSPSRVAVHTYRDLRGEIERLVGNINGKYGGRGCIPIDYRYESLSHEALAVHYRSANVALVTPLRDGMNLVAKEFVASRVDEKGVLVLSRFAGAARELDDALLVNPYDVEGMAEQIYRAITMSEEEQRRRMQHLRSVVRRNNVYWWLERFLHDIDLD